MNYQMQIPNPKSLRILTFMSGKYQITIDTEMSYYVHEWRKEGAYGPFREETQALKYLIDHLVKEVEKCNNK